MISQDDTVEQLPTHSSAGASGPASMGRPSAAAANPPGGCPPLLAHPQGEEGPLRRAVLAAGATAGGRALPQEGKPAAGPAPATSMTPCVIGLDLSLTGAGVALPDGGTHTLRQGSTLRGVERLQALRTAVMQIVHPSDDLIVIEGPAYSRALQQGHHEAAGLWWLIACALAARELPVAVVAPNVLKKYATGRGNATKADMRMALFQRAGLDERDDNRVDAWWLRAVGLDHLGHPPIPMPAAHRAALDKVRWPTLTQLGGTPL